MANSNFTITIRDIRSNTDPVVYNIEGLGWVLLSKFADRYYIYSWSEQDWQPISKDEFAKFKAGYSFAEISTGTEHGWLEIPMNTKPAMMSELSDLFEFNEQSNLPPGLEIAKANFLRDKG